MHLLAILGELWESVSPIYMSRPWKTSWKTAKSLTGIDFAFEFLPELVLMNFIKKSFKNVWDY